MESLTENQKLIRARSKFQEQSAEEYVQAPFVKVLDEGRMVKKVEIPNSAFALWCEFRKNKCYIWL